MLITCLIQLIQLQDERTVIGKDLFKKETNIQLFVGLKVQLSTGILLLQLFCKSVIPVCCLCSNELFLSHLLSANDVSYLILQCTCLISLCYDNFGTS